MFLITGQCGPTTGQRGAARVACWSARPWSGVGTQVCLPPTPPPLQVSKGGGLPPCPLMSEDSGWAGLQHCRRCHHHTAAPGTHPTLEETLTLGGREVLGEMRGPVQEPLSLPPAPPPALLSLSPSSCLLFQVFPFPCLSNIAAQVPPNPAL